MAMTMREITMAILKAMEDCDFSKNTIYDYSSTLGKFIKEAEECSKPGYYSLEVIECVLLSLRIRLETGEISKNYYQSYCRAAYLLEAYTKTGSFVWKTMPLGSKYALNTRFFQATLEKAMGEMGETTHLSPSTVEQYGHTIRKFCYFLESEGITNFLDLTLGNVVGFIESTHKTDKSSMDNIIRYLKTFLKFLNHRGLCTVVADISVLKPIRRREKNIIYFTKDEVHRLLDSFTFDKWGLRDFAILLLAIHTGMRRSDVCNLRLQDVSWENYTIDIRQKKTGRKTTIPLMPSAGNALADYILHERPQSASEHIFLVPTHPIRPLTGNGVDGIVRKRCKWTGIEKPSKCSLHSFRRSLATWLSQESEPVEEIAQCLGHANVHSADRYVFASPSMQDCCLGFKGIEPKGWVAK